MVHRITTTLLIFIFFSSISFSQTDPLNLPLFNISNMSYEGAFRIPANTYGASSVNYSQGPIAYNPDNHSMFIVGHSHHQEIAEFIIPALVNSSDLSDLNMADDPIQNFSTVLYKASGGNTQNIDRIGGLYYMKEGENSSLLINAYEYYDAAGTNTHTSLMLENADALETSDVEGYYEFEGGAGHTSGWVSSIPAAWQGLLGGSMITGQSSGIPIISRTSVGPSAFAFNPSDIPAEVATNNTISTNRLLDFSLTNPLRSDLSNSDLSNKIWTHLSRVTYGMIVPGTRTYLTIGHSGGHESGVCYKCTQDDGNLCGGYCTPIAADNSKFYWLWDIADLVKVKNGIINPWEVEPYDYGPLSLPFLSDEIGGGSFDPVSGILYISLQNGDTDQGTYARPPLINAFSFGSSTLPVELVLFEGVSLNKKIDFNWQTESEIEVEKFVLEEWKHNLWNEIGSLPSLGNSTTGNNYSLSINNVGSGVRIFRLKIMDHDGAISYSHSIKVISQEEYFSISPNPVGSTLWINKSTDVGTLMEINILSSDGTSIIRKKVKSARNEKSRIDVSSLKPGFYYIQVFSENGNGKAMRFVKN